MWPSFSFHTYKMPFNSQCASKWQSHSDFIIGKIKPFLKIKIEQNQHKVYKRHSLSLAFDSWYIFKSWKLLANMITVFYHFWESFHFPNVHSSCSCMVLTLQTRCEGDQSADKPIVMYKTWVTKWKRVKEIGRQCSFISKSFTHSFWQFTVIYVRCSAGEFFWVDERSNRR